MTADRVYFWLTLAAFATSFALYRRGRKAGGDRLLFLAWALMISGWLAMLDRWGVLVR